jgi:TPR repeat protein
MLGSMSRDLFPEGYDPDALVLKWMPAAVAGDTRAMAQLATAYLAKEDWPAAESWARRAVEGGETFGMYALAEALKAQGDEAGAQEWRQRAAQAQRESPSGRATARMVAPITDRFGEDPDLDEVRTAAEAGEEVAMTALGTLLTLEEPEEAVRWLTPRAEAGDALAMFSLGAALSMLGDEEGGERWMERSAETGEPVFMKMYSDMTAHTGDEEKAQYWARRVQEAEAASDGTVSDAAASGGPAAPAPDVTGSPAPLASPDTAP